MCTIKYFITETERKKWGTCFFEFQRGKYRGKCWLNDSLNLHADKFDEAGLYDLFSDAIEDFYYYGVNVVNEEQWENLVEKSYKNDTWNEIIRELTPWVVECFKRCKYFTICGI